MFLLKKCEVKSSFFLFFLLSLSASCFSFEFAGGTGEPNDPYQIATAAQLLSIGSDPNLLNKCYILLNDIDLDPNVTGIPPFTRAPIAPDTNPSSSDFQGTKFTGIFDGNSQKIRNLKIDTLGNGNDFLGLFGYIDGSAAQVKNLGIENVAIKGGTGSDCLGGLCGANFNSGMISNCYATGSVTGGGNSQTLGSLCGINSGTISNSCGTGSITSGTGSWFLGGLCGFNHLGGTISNCYTLGSVTASDNSVFLGGLCGGNGNGTIINCYSYGQVIGGANSCYLGGLCGDNGDTIVNCHANSQVNGGAGSYYLGGLCGYNDSTLIRCYSKGHVVGGTGSDCLGGLCGENYSGIINTCYATGNVSGGENSQYIGGLCGKNYLRSTISGCYSAGAVTGGVGSLYIGGLCARNSSGTISNCFWDIQTSDCNTSDGGTGKTTAEMKKRVTFTDAGWDFVGEIVNDSNDFWRMCVDGVSYPKLAWEFTSGDLICPDGVDFIDFAFFANFWLNSDCASLNNCSRSDFDLSGIVDPNDLSIFTSHWLQQY